MIPNMLPQFGVFVGVAGTLLNWIIQLTLQEKIQQTTSRLAIVLPLFPQTLVQNPASESRQEHS